MITKTLSLKSMTEEWNQRGFSCAIWSDSPGKVWKDYIHDTDELVMLIEGEVEFVFDNETFYPKVGEELLIPAHTKHTVTNIGKTQNRWFYGYKKN